MLPILIDLIIIFESWVMGILQQFIFALMRWGFFFVFFLSLVWLILSKIFFSAFISLKYVSSPTAYFAYLLVLETSYFRCFGINAWQYLSILASTCVLLKVNDSICFPVCCIQGWRLGICRSPTYWNWSMSTTHPKETCSDQIFGQEEEC